MYFKAGFNCLSFQLNNQLQPSPSALSSCPAAHSQSIKYTAWRGLLTVLQPRVWQKTTSTTKPQNKQRKLTTTTGRKSLATTYSPLNEAGFPFHGLLADFWRLPLPGFSCCASLPNSPLNSQAVMAHNERAGNLVLTWGAAMVGHLSFAYMCAHVCGLAWDCRHYCVMLFSQPYSAYYSIHTYVHIQYIMHTPDRKDKRNFTFLIRAN